ncbi:MBL fold metallo-hydrolase [Neopusillimonas aromaticivorans]|uniref:MBL fold metallo-hydrolase n=1 Tax=Neopusillimonas aromaticivorans TaxID=2979868 RepID=UPI0025940256|nr:MBL fold metallo-hydrolase [Neopusillimonas aromaticivorans]WJJ92651.1 MBL fold metallo-hydrolase [Neopusillimonas aromaticivorans]
MTSYPSTLSAPRYVLKPDVVIEPLVAGWHASSLLVSPLSMALISAKRHLPMLESWLHDPDLHAAAVQDPDLLGGPFMDIPRPRPKRCRPSCTGVAMLWRHPCLWRLPWNRHGHCLRPTLRGKALGDLYKALPPALQGLTELVYTPTGAPDIRPLEGLLYRSEYYIPKLQQAMVRRIPGDQRSFSMATPRLPCPGDIVLDRPFCDPAYDVLARARQQPMPLPVLLDAFNLEASQAERLMPLLDEAPDTPASPAVPRAASRWRYFGHACVLVETADGRSILIDPVIAYESGQAPDRLTLADLPDHIDYLLITHNHPDHALIETLLALRWKTGTVLVPASSGSIVDPSLKACLQAIGFTHVEALDSLEHLDVNGLTLQAIPFLGEHADLDIRSKTSWLVDTGDLRLLFAADSNNLDPALNIRLKPVLGRLSALFLGMECQGAPMSWLYGALLARPPRHDHDQSRRLNGSDAERAWALVACLDVDEVLIYAMGLEPWLTFICGIDGSRDSLPCKSHAVSLNAASSTAYLPAACMAVMAAATTIKPSR